MRSSSLSVQQKKTKIKQNRTMQKEDIKHYRKFQGCLTQHGCGEEHVPMLRNVTEDPSRVKCLN